MGRGRPRGMKISADRAWDVHPLEAGYMILVQRIVRQSVLDYRKMRREKSVFADTIKRDICSDYFEGLTGIAPEEFARHLRAIDAKIEESERRENLCS